MGLQGWEVSVLRIKDEMRKITIVTFINDRLPPKIHRALVRLPRVASRRTKVPAQGRGWIWRLSQKLTLTDTQVVCRSEGRCLPDLLEKTRKQDRVRQIPSRKHGTALGLPRPRQLQSAPATYCPAGCELKNQLRAGPADASLFSYRLWANLMLFIL